MRPTTTFHEDVYYAYFLPFRHPLSRFNIWGRHGLETFGGDLQIATSFDRTFVWTVVDGGEGPDQWITPGLHYVNRVCYLLTQVPHDWAPIARRITRLRRIMKPIKTILAILTPEIQRPSQDHPYAVRTPKR